MAFKVLDLFSGAGGLSRGFYDAGYDVVLGVDFDEAALKTFKANHGGAEAMKLDLFDHGNIDVIIDFLEKKKIKLDVLVGGPPCQGFSVAGPRDMNDKRNTLYTAMVKLASGMPKAMRWPSIEPARDLADSQRRLLSFFAKSIASFFAWSALS